MEQNHSVRKIASIRPLARFARISVRDLLVTVAPLILITVIVIGVAYWFVRPAPPNTITITSGPNGSIFQLNAEKNRLQLFEAVQAFLAPIIRESWRLAM